MTASAAEWITPVFTTSSLRHSVTPSLPVSDWQFWFVTTIFVAAAIYFLRGVLPLGKKRRKARAKRVPLTVDGKPASRAGSGGETGCERCGEG